MVNFNSPAVVEQDFSAFAFASGSDSVEPEDLTNSSLRRGAPAPLAYYIWDFPVGAFCCVRITISSPLLVGSTLQLLTMSGMSSEGVGPTGGRYGSVTTRCSQPRIFSSGIYTKFTLW
jgi:hypothetical protein